MGNNLKYKGHTPGPWRVRELKVGGQTTDCFVTANDVNGFAYGAEILGDDEYDHDKTNGMQRKLADCHLIADAPDLLAKCQTLEERVAEALVELSKANSHPRWYRVKQILEGEWTSKKSSN